MSFYVYSTITADVVYTKYKPTGDKSLPVAERRVLIKGGNMVAQSGNFYTPHGVVTEVSKEEMEMLEQDYHFNKHKERGFIKVEKKEVPIKKVVKDMAEKDGSAPKVPGDFKPRDKDGDVNL